MEGYESECAVTESTSNADLGGNCDIDMDECASSPCQNEGGCTTDIETPDSYNCSCAAGFVGENCAVDVDECVPSLCLNDATCTESGSINSDVAVNTYSCNCTAGFTGDNCADDVDECSSSPCMNQGA